MSAARGKRWRQVANAILGACVLVGTAAPADSQNDLRKVGWHEFPNTSIRAVCPPNDFAGSGYAFKDNCNGITEAWNSAMMDTTRNRLILWGGGHNDYLGNELYSLELDNFKLKRITDPAVPVNSNGCEEALADGTQPNSRHTYDAVTYMEHADRLFVFGGSLAGCGFMSRGTWTFSFERSQWTRHRPKGPIPRNDPGVIAVYDSNTRKVFVHDNEALYSYDLASDRYEGLAGSVAIDYHMTGVIDPNRKKLVIVGSGRVYTYDIGPGGWYSRRTVKTTGGEPIVNSIYPGLAYHPDTSRIIAWNGGDTVYSLDLDTRAWTALRLPGGPGPAIQNGTFKRWSYSAASRLFVVINEVDRNAYALRVPTDDSRSTTR